MTTGQTEASAPPAAIRAVLFDFDYTLADSSEGIIRCIHYALTQLGLPPAPPERVRQTIGLSLADTWAFLTGDGQQGSAQEFTRLFVQMSDQIMVASTVVYPATRRAIQGLRALGLCLGIVSTKYRYRIEAVLAREGLAEDWQVVVGGEDVSAHKPHPEGLLLAAERLGLAPSACLYVGDSPTDAEAASRAGMPFVATRTGVTPPEAWEAHHPVGIVPDVGALPDLLLRWGMHSAHGA